MSNKTPHSAAPSSRYDAFISYSRKDSDIVMQLRQRLEAAGKEIWLDADDIPKGEDWAEQIRRGIELADNFIVILSPDSICSEECAKEIDYAIANHKRLLPVVVRYVEHGDVRPEVRKINFIMPGRHKLDGLIDDILRTMDTNVQHAQAHTMLLAKALDWDGQNRSRGFLIRGAQLVNAEHWLSMAPDNGDPSPTVLQSEFIRASRTAATRFMRVVFAGVTAFLIVALVLTGLFLAQRSQRLVALRAEYLSLQSESFVRKDPTIAFDLARKAYTGNSSNQKTQILLRSLYHESVDHPFYIVLEPGTGDYKRALAAFGGDPFQRYLARLPIPKQTLFAARATWDGRYVMGWRALAANDAQINDVELQDRQGRIVLSRSGSFQIAVPDNPDPLVVPSPDGKLIFVAAGDSPGHLYDADGRLIREFTVGELFERTGIVPDDEIGPVRFIKANFAHGEAMNHCIGAGPGSLGIIPSDERITSAAFSTDNRKLAVAYYTYEQWVFLAFFDLSAAGEPSLDVEATACLQISKGGNAPTALAGRGPIAALRFSPDGQRLLAAGRDGGAAVYELGDEYGISRRQYRRIATLESARDRFVEVAWQSNDTPLTASADGSLKRWDLSTPTFAAAATAAVPTIETDPETCRKQRETALRVDQASGETWSLRDAQNNRVALLRDRPIYSPCGTYILDRSGLQGRLLSGDGQPLTRIAGPPGDRRWMGRLNKPAVKFSADEQLLLTIGTKPQLAWPLSAAAVIYFVENLGQPGSAQRFSSADLQRYGITE